MNKDAIHIQIFGTLYPIKCAPSEVDALQKTAYFLEEKMNAVRNGNGTLTLDRVAVITALNLAHELMTYEEKSHQAAENMNQRLQDLQDKIDVVIAKNKQMELLPAE